MRKRKRCQRLTILACGCIALLTLPLNGKTAIACVCMGLLSLLWAEHCGYWQRRQENGEEDIKTMKLQELVEQVREDQEWAFVQGFMTATVIFLLIYEYAQGANM